MSELTWSTGGGRVTQVVTHRVRVQPPRSMKAITGDVEALLGGLDEDTRRSGGLLATELIAQVVGRAPGWNSQPVALTIQLRTGCRTHRGDRAGYANDRNDRLLRHGP